MTTTLPELLAPAGSMRTLETALRFGADAVYCGLPRFGLRAGARNLTKEELPLAAGRCHQAGARLHLTLNIFATDGDLGGMADTARLARDAGVDALIVSDLGAIAKICREVPGIQVHVSTQASTTNSGSCRVYRDLGASRVVLSRELPLTAIREMAAHLAGEMELESFVHGAICMAYSGRCLLSCALSGRSANRGSCSQPCRWTYALQEEKRPGEYFPLEEGDRGTAILSSRDLCLLQDLPELMEAGIASFKIEGRMKNELYVAPVTGAYRRAMDAIGRGEWTGEVRDACRRELDFISHRVYDTGFYFGAPRVCGGAVGTREAAEYVGFVLEASGGEALVEMRNRFVRGDVLTAVTPSGTLPVPVERIHLEDGTPVEQVTVPLSRARIPVPGGVAAGDLLRGPVRNRAAGGEA